MCVAKGSYTSNEAIGTILDLFAAVSCLLNYCECTLFLLYPRCVVSYDVRVEDDHAKVKSPGSSRNVDAVSVDGKQYNNDHNNDFRTINIEVFNIKDYITYNNINKNIGKIIHLCHTQTLKWDKEVPEAPPESHAEL